MKRQKIYEAAIFITPDGIPTTFEKCSVVLGTLGKRGFAYPVVKERFPEDTQKGDQFFWAEGNDPLQKVTQSRSVSSGK